jgi:hypothetical protein
MKVNGRENAFPYSSSRERRSKSCEIFGPGLDTASAAKHRSSPRSGKIILFASAKKDLLPRKHSPR